MGKKSEFMLFMSLGDHNCRRLIPACKGPTLINHRFSCLLFKGDKKAWEKCWGGQRFTVFVQTSLDAMSSHQILLRSDETDLEYKNAIRTK